MHHRLEPQRAASTLVAASLLAFITLLVGCASSAPRLHAVQYDRDSALLFPPTWNTGNAFNDALTYDHALDAWEYGRNDAAMNYRPFALDRPPGIVETYTRDRFYSYGGRLYENSRYEIRSYRAR